MELIYTNAAHEPQGMLNGFELDMAYGESENNFELSVTTAQRLEVGAFVYEYGTEHGGVIDSEEYDSTGRVPRLVYFGRTWHGILENSVVKPDAGQDHLYVSGDLNDCISLLINRQGLQGVFAASEGASGLVLTNYQIPRYVSLYDALNGLVAWFGKRLAISKRGGLCEVGFSEVDYHVGGAGDNMPIVLKNIGRQTNHLVLLGKGELASRLVRDVYADVLGNVSTVQSMFGLDELAEIYETNSEEDPVKLVDKGLEKLRDMQSKSEVKISVPDGESYHIGDVVQGVAPEFGMSAQAVITKQILEVDKNGTTTISCIVGEPRLT